jgi:transposase
MEKERKYLREDPPYVAYSEAFKRRVVSEIERGLLTETSARGKYGIGGKMTVGRWRRKYGKRARVGGKMKDQLSKEAMQERIRLLEEALADEKLKRMAAEKVIEIAEREFKLPIRKKYGPKQ